MESKTIKKSYSFKNDINFLLGKILDTSEFSQSFKRKSFTETMTQKDIYETKIITNIIKSETIKKYYNSEKEYSNKIYIKIYPRKIGTIYDLSDLFETVYFSFDDIKLHAQNKIAWNSKGVYSFISLYVEDNSLDGYIYDKNYNNYNMHKSVDIYDKILFFIKWQEYLSLLNYKLNNKLPLNILEIKLNKILHNKKNNIVMTEIISKKEKRSLKEIDFNNFFFPDIFFDDVNKIKKDHKIEDIKDQLKLDIYNYLFEKNKISEKYEEEIKIMCYYYLIHFYPKIAIGYAITNENKEVESEIVQTPTKKEKILISC